MRKFIISFVLYLLLVIAGIASYYLFFQEKEVELEDGMQLMNEVKKVKDSYADDDHDHDYSLAPNKATDNVFQDINKTISYFFATVIEGEPELFVNMFEPMQYSKDLYSVSDNPYEEELTNQFISRISRNGKLEKVFVKDKKTNEVKYTARAQDIKVRLVYSDGKEANIIIDLTLLGTEHEQSDRIYYVSTSVIKIIEQIEKQTL